MFTQSARYYDAIYSFKDYARDAERVHALIQQYKQSAGSTLLDVACGTGALIPYLRQHYMPEGLDLDEGMLAVARQRHPDIPFHQADMVHFDLGRAFDVVLCMFSSIGYVKTVPRLQSALQSLSRHVKPGGLVLVEPWLTPENYRGGGVHALFVDQPDLKIARMNLSRQEDRVSIMDFHYLVGTPEGITHFTERHELGLFTPGEYREAFEAAGLEVVYQEPARERERGIYVGRRPLA